MLQSCQLASPSMQNPSGVRCAEKAERAKLPLLLVRFKPTLYSLQSSSLTKYVAAFKSALIRFGLSFLEHGSTSTKEDVMQIKDFYEPLFSDLYLEREETLRQAISIIQQSIIRDEGVSRNARIKFFNAKLLASVGWIWQTWFHV